MRSLSQSRIVQCALKAKWLLVVAVIGQFALAGCGGNTSQDTAAAGAANDSHATPKIPSEHSEGLAVYTEKCALCHDHGEAAAPRLGNPKQWAKRVPQGESVLTKHAIEGFEGKWGEMPPQGDDLTPEQVGSAVRYMLYRFELGDQTK